MALNDIIDSIILEQLLTNAGLKIEKHAHYHILQQVRAALEYPVEDAVWLGMSVPIDNQIIVTVDAPPAFQAGSNSI